MSFDVVEGRTSRDDIFVSQIVDLDILDVVAIRDIHVSTNNTAFFGLSEGRRGSRVGVGWRLDGGDIRVIDAFLSLELSINLGSSGSYFWEVRILTSRSSFREEQRGDFLPAAAAGSTLGLFVSPSAREIGLRSRGASERLEGGDRDRRSNRDGRLGSGSVWSKRDRFMVRRSASSMPRDDVVIDEELGSERIQIKTAKS